MHLIQNTYGSSTYIWRRDRDSNPGYGVNPYNALAGRPLRPLGHLSVFPVYRESRTTLSAPCSTTPAASSTRASLLLPCTLPYVTAIAPRTISHRAWRPDASLRRLVESERLVQGAHCELHVFFVDHHRDLDLGSRDHLDVDAFLGEGAEHLARNTGVGAHADAHHGHLADLVVPLDIGGLDMALHLSVENVERLLVLVAVHGERQVGHAVNAGILDDHVDVDVGVADRPENGVGDPRAVGHAHHGDL